MSQENRRKALSPRQPLNGQRIFEGILLRTSGSRQNEVKKDLLRLGTVNVGALSERSREVVDMFERRKVVNGCLKKVRYRDQGTRIYEGEEKYTSFGGVD